MRACLCGMILCVVAGIALGQWEPDQRLTDDPANSFLCGQRCIVASGDTLHVIFVDNRTDTFSLYYTRSLDAGVAWDSAVRLSTSPDGDIFAATVAAAGTGVHVVWEVDGNQVLKYRRSTDAGTSWLTEESLVVSTRSCGGPFLAAEGGNVGLAWGDSRDGNYNGELYFKQSGDAGLTWTSDTRITFNAEDSAVDKEACLAVVGNHRYIVWTRWDWNTSVQQTWFIRSTDEGATWEQESRLTADTTSQGYPMVTAAGPSVHACWWDGRTGGAGIYYRRSTDNGTTWNAEQYLTDTLYGTDYPAIAAAGRNVYLVYRAWPGGQFVFDYRASTDNGLTWSAETALTTAAGMGTANLAATGSRAHVLLYDNREGNFEIYQKRNLTAGAIEETPSAEARTPNAGSNLVRGVLDLPSVICSLQSDIALVDASGRRILTLRPGPNDVSHLAPGVYFISGSSAVAKVIIQK